MANPAREEVEINFGGKTYTIRPTITVLSGVESVTGKSTFKLADQCWGPSPDEWPTLTEVAQIMFQIVYSVDPKITADKVGEILLEDGILDLMPPLRNFLGRAFKGNKTHIALMEKEAKKVIENPPLEEVSST